MIGGLIIVLYGKQQKISILMDQFCKVIIISCLLIINSFVYSQVISDSVFYHLEKSCKISTIQVS